LRLWILQIKVPANVLQLIYGAGIGAKRSHGFGMERIRSALAFYGQPPQTIETLGYGFVMTMREPAAGGMKGGMKSSAMSESTARQNYGACYYEKGYQQNTANQKER